MRTDQVPHPMQPGVGLIAVWIALGGAGWAILGSVLMLAMRLVG